MDRPERGLSKNDQRVEEAFVAVDHVVLMQVLKKECDFGEAVARLDLMGQLFPRLVEEPLRTETMRRVLESKLRIATILRRPVPECEELYRAVVEAGFTDTLRAVEVTKPYALDLLRQGAGEVAAQHLRAVAAMLSDEPVHKEEARRELDELHAFMRKHGWAD